MDIVTYAILNGKIKDYASNVDEWLEENVDPATGYVLDRSLQMENAAAPADMVGDISDTVSDVKNTLNHKADAIYDTASGGIASFLDGADGLPVKDLTVGIEPVQSGTGDPSPTNVRPISGWTGANVTRTGKNLAKYISPNGYYNIQGEFIIDNYNGRNKPIKLTEGQIITASTRTGNFRSVSCAFFSDANATNFLSRTSTVLDAPSASFTAPANCFAIVAANISTDIVMNEQRYQDNVQIEFGPASSFEPYSGTTLPISWQSEAGTVYGGTLDVTSGVLTVTDANIASYNGETLPGEWISDRDVYAAGTTPTTGAQVVYKLATPQTYQLDTVTVTTLLGQNNIWADCGPSTVEYPADTKLYIQKINAPTDDDMIADANIASGKYFIVNNNLYISTAAILAGDPIKPGTNCTLTNLAAALNAINS